MLNNKVYVFVANKKNYIKFFHSLKDYYTDITFTNHINDLLMKIDQDLASDKNKMNIFFIEYPFLHDVATYLSKKMDSLSYILVAFSNKKEALSFDISNLFDFIYTDYDDFDFNFFYNRLHIELTNKKRIFLLQFEVKEYYEIGKSLSSEKNSLKLFEMIINSSMKLTSSDAGTMYLVIDKDTGKWSSVNHHNAENALLNFVIAKNTSMDIKLEESISPITRESIFGYTILTGKPVRIDDVYNISPKVDYNHNHSFDQKVGYKTRSILSIPMKDNKNNIMGVIQLINKKKNFDKVLDYHNKDDINEIIPFHSSDELIMNSLAGQAAVALENNLLYEGMQELLENYKEQNEQLLFLSRKILKAHEEERRRIAREIHDGPAQSTANLSLKLEICKKFFKINEPEKAYLEMNDLKKDINATIKEIRTIIYDLKPSYLEGGLFSAIDNRLKIFQDTTNIKVDFKASGDDSNIEYYMASTVYRIIQEGLSNIYKHAEATHIRIELFINDKKIFFSIDDNGKGFNTSDLSKKKQRHLEGGFGLEGIKERIELVKGEISINSEIGKGTHIIAHIPVL